MVLVLSSTASDSEAALATGLAQALAALELDYPASK
jgi:hypothetical protein